MTFDSLTLNGKYLEREALQRHCTTKLESLSMPQWERSICKFILDWLNPEDAILLKTSGSTGKPKILQARKSAMIASAHLTQQTFDLKADDKALLCLPADYIAGKMMVVRAFVCGLNLFTVEPSATPLRQVSNHFFKLVSMIPLQLFQYQKTHSREECLSYFNQIDTLLIGGATIPESTERFIYDLPCKSFHTYGMTETFSHIAFRNIRSGSTTYQTLSGVTVKTNADDCLVVNAPQLGIQALETTDIATIFSDKAFTLIGRASNTIHTGGVKVQPEDIERKIQAQFKQYPVLVFPSENEKLGKQVNLAVEADYDEVLEQQIKAIVQNLKALNKYERPKRLLFTKPFIYTTSGKLQRTQTIHALTKKL